MYSIQKVVSGREDNSSVSCLVCFRQESDIPHGFKLIHTYIYTFAFAFTFTSTSTSILPLCRLYIYINPIISYPYMLYVHLVLRPKVDVYDVYWALIYYTKMHRRQQEDLLPLSESRLSAGNF